MGRTKDTQSPLRVQQVVDFFESTVHQRVEVSVIVLAVGIADTSVVVKDIVSAKQQRTVE